MHQAWKTPLSVNTVWRALLPLRKENPSLFCDDARETTQENRKTKLFTEVHTRNVDTWEHPFTHSTSELRESEEKSLSKVQLSLVLFHSY